MKTMAIKVGISVGHFGPGTGTSNGATDEWTLANTNAHAIVLRLHEEGKLVPVLMSINREEHPWDLIQQVSKASLPSFLGALGNVDVRYEWAIREQVSALVELHFNSALVSNPTGHEVWMRTAPGPLTKSLGTALMKEFGDRLGNPGRGLRQKAFRILFKLHAANVPAVILEPAFIREECIVREEWQMKYRDAVVTALYAFFKV
jgi:N-acetylmuramoyl-L-alanine amidase